jgi:hypothetical protein
MISNLVPSSPAVEEITQGDTINWVFALPSYPGDQWTGQLSFTQAGSKVGAPANLVADPMDVTHWMVTVDSATSAKLPVGTCAVYTVMTRVALPNDRVSLFQGDVTVLPNPLGTMPQTPNMQALAAVNRTINIVLAQPEQSASFNGQTYTLHNIKDLFDIRTQLESFVSGEMAAVGVSHGKNFKILQDRFV